MIRVAIACAALAATAGSANAVFFSFASDTTDQSWTWKGNGASVTDATGPLHPTTLLIDDNNGMLPRLEVSTQFDAQLTLQYIGSVPLPGGSFSHNYIANGSFSFTDIPAGVALLTTTFTNALWTARGAANSWYSTATLQADDGGGATVSMVWGGAALPAYGIAGPGPLGVPAGFAFDLTVLNTSGVIPYNFANLGVALDPQTKLPVQQWWSEGSYSAAAIPSPAGLAVLGLGGLMAGRRRRA